MNIPEIINIGGHIIKIREETTETLDNPGVYDNYHNLIRLRVERDTPEDNVSEAFLHEIFEAIKAKNNLELSHKDLTVLSESLFQIIRSNRLDFTK